VDGDCCAGLACEIPPGATSGACGTGAACASTGQSCSATVGCCAAEEQCLDGTCQAPQLCTPQAQHCVVDADCCGGLTCNFLDVGNVLVACPAGETTCTCEVPPQACVPIPDACTAAGTPCCGGYCALASNTGLACDGVNPCVCAGE
jgi:hypothetical protein